MENPKLALIPSGYKSGKVYSILPVNGVGDFDYERNGYASRVRKDGLIEELTVDDTPRLDWLNSDCPSLLLEPQRTNLLTYSQELSQWTKQNLTITDNDAISPEGISTASKVLETAANSFHFAYNGVISAISSTDYSYSIFVKKLGRQYVGIQTLFNTVKGAIALFDLDNGSLVYTFQQGGHTVNNASIENYANDWYKISATFQVNDSTAVFGLVTADELWSSGTSYNNAYLGDITKGVYAFGGQVEQGSYPTSYIKTTGGIVTRQKDQCFNGGDADLFDITEGTFFTDVTSYDSGNVTVIGLSIGNDTQKIIFQFQANGTQIRIFSSGGVSSFLSLTFDQQNKIAVTFKENEYKFFINGALVGSDTSATVPTGMDRLNFSNRSNTANHFEGKVHDTRVYDRVLTEAEAIKLTTI